MMYRTLTASMIALAFAGGYWANMSAPAQGAPTQDLSTLSAMPLPADTPDGGQPVITEQDQGGDAADGSHVGRAADGLFYVNATVNGQKVRFLVDTGASVTVLSAKDARAVGAMPTMDQYTSHMATAGGSRSMAWTRLGEVRVAGRKVRGVTAAVVSGGPSVSLLGQNLLSQLGAVRIEGDRLEFAQATPSS